MPFYYQNEKREIMNWLEWSKLTQTTDVGDFMLRDSIVTRIFKLGLGFISLLHSRF